MPYQYNLADVKESALKSIAGVCTDSDEFVALVNEAQRRLLRRGTWFNTDITVKVCIYNGCLTWPRYVGTVLGVRFCCIGDTDIRNEWFRIMGPPAGDWHGSSTVTVYDDGVAPTFNEITGCDTGKTIRAYIEKRNDVGKTIRLFGIRADSNLPIQERNDDDDWVDGVTLTLGASPAATPMLVSRITSVVKQRTQGHVFLYEYDAATGLMRMLAIYGPGETNPSYRRSKIRNFCSVPTACDETDGVQYRSVEALVKLAFVPVVSDTDWLLIDNFDALKFAVQAIRLEEANNDEEAEGKWVKAIRELNYELREKSPGPQTVVRVNPVGHAIVGQM